LTARTLPRQSEKRSMEPGQATFWVAILQIVWVDILLAGDNAVVIAMAVRSLPDRTRWWGIVLGTGVAIVMRIVFAGVVTQLLLIPGLRIAGGLALIWIAIDLLLPKAEQTGPKVAPADTLLRAVGTIAIADLVMSLDNVVAIAGIAKGSWLLISIGVAVSIPIIIGGAALITQLIDRFPLLVQAGAALLGWIAGDMIVGDPFLAGLLDPGLVRILHYPAAVTGAILVLGLGAMIVRMRRRRARTTKDSGPH
jgi:YjbE family integral membrane protein